jgi:hypothetical protein
MSSDKPDSTDIAAAGRAIPRVEERMVDRMVRVGVRGLYHKNRRLSLALQQERAAMIDELGGPERAGSSGMTLVDVIVRTRMLVDTLDGLLLEIGPGIVNKRKKFAYPLLAQRQSLADSLTSQLSAFHALKEGGDFERRLEALEEGKRNVPSR